MQGTSSNWEKMREGELRLTLEFENDSGDTQAAKEEMLRECRSLAELFNNNATSAKIGETGEMQPGAKGIPLVIGSIVLDAVTGGAVKGIFDCIKTWLVARRKEFTFHVEKGGVKIDFHSSNLDEQQITLLTAKLGELVSGSGGG